MSTALAIWSQLVEADKIVQFDVLNDVHVTQVVFGEKLADKKRTSVKAHIVRPDEDEDDEDEDAEASTTEEKETLVLAHLVPGQIESQLVDLILNEGTRVEFEVTGKNSVYLFGNYISQPYPAYPGNQIEEDEEEEEDEDYEDDEDLEAFNNLTEEEKEKLLESLMRGEDDEEMEDVPAPPSKGNKKRPAEIEAPSSESKASNKKIKAADGKAAAAPAPKTDASSEKEKTKKAEKKEKTKATEEKTEAPAAKAGKSFKTAGGVIVEDKVVGTGKAAKKGKSLKMRYILKLANGKIVDKNTSGKPFKFRLGAGEVIKGWDEGLVGMQVGGERKLEVPPAMGYGKRKMSDIPANSTLYFEVKLLDADA